MPGPQSPDRALTEWSVVYEHWDPSAQPLREALTTLGNGSHTIGQDRGVRSSTAGRFTARAAPGHLV